MFDRDHQIKGRHASYAKYLRDTTKVFKRHIDIYMVGAIMGILHRRQAPIDNTTKDDVMIFADVFHRENMKCQYIYRLIMLLDETSNLTLEQRIDRAFRDDTDEQSIENNLSLFNGYVRGGIEYLYEKFSEDCITEDDYINKVYEIVDRFKTDIDINKGKPHEDLIESIIDNG